MTNQPPARLLRVFISSPGDVSSERRVVLDAIEQIAHDPLLRTRVTCEGIAWDKPGEDVLMQATFTPQEAVDRQLPMPAECDIVVVILWARFGTPLPPPYQKPNGEPFNSGTEWEYFNALEGARQRGLPKVVVYRRAEMPQINLDDEHLDAKRLQWQRVKDFFTTFGDPDTGVLLQGYNTYAKPDDFKARFSRDLRQLVSEILDDTSIPTLAPPPALPPRPKGGYNFEEVRRLNYDDSELNQWHRRFQDDVRHWHDNHRPSGDLYTSKRLQDARRYFKRHPDVVPSAAELAFLAASRRRVWLSQGLLFLLLLGYLVISLPALARLIESSVLFAQSSSPQVAFPARTARLGDDAQVRVRLDAYAIDRYEVSNRQYSYCVQVGQCTLPESYATLAQFQQADPTLPVTEVTAYQAAAFCRWLGRRLPTAAEWEQAARGTDGRLWPWGNEDPLPEWVNVAVEANGNPPPYLPAGLVPVSGDEFANGSTPEGVMHLIGNAWEWTSTPLNSSTSSGCTTPYCLPAWDGVARVEALQIRGYGWRDILYSAATLTDDEPTQITVAMGAIPGFDISDDIGFRCVSL